MNYVKWTVQILTALIFIMAGGMKMGMPYEQLSADPNMAWTLDFSPIVVKLIGFVEILGAFGLILPAIFKTQQKLIPIAAAGLALTMIGATAVHVMRGESMMNSLIVLIFPLLVAFFRKDLLKS
jgi:uncharacterized membrane protein YphA (DoxX/SURF4 family)